MMVQTKQLLQWSAMALLVANVVALPNTLFAIAELRGGGDERLSADDE